MTDSRNPERLIQAFLSEGVEELSDQVYDSVRDQLHHNRQRVVIGPLRMPIMSNTAVRLGIAAAAVVLVAFLGIKFLPWSNIGDPTASPTATPEPTSFPLQLGDADLGRQLNSGSYRVAGKFAVPFTITLPRDWSLSTLEQTDVRFRAGAHLNFRDAYLVVDLIENVFDLPCQSDGKPMDPPVPPTVDGFVEALTHMVGFTAGPVSEVRLGGRQFDQGHDGKAFELTSAINTDCTQDLHLWTVRGGGIGGYSERGATMQILVIDVGGTIVVIDGESFPATTDAVKAELQAIVGSIRFE